jgi:propionyl-CoA carboxylase alpha chain
MRAFWDTPMFNKILVANRGEISCRIMATARRMGIASVAVYSEADRNALHVEMADEAVPIGPAPASESYLVIERIVAACKKTGAEAVHPGYGFLAESANFARALEENGIAFIGPHARAIAEMGDKVAAKALAQSAGIPAVPGFPHVIEDASQVEAAAASIGYPLMIKAAAGGGGRGMRAVFSPETLAGELARAQSEANAAFGDGRVFLEKYIPSPRHIEVQLLADKHGSVIHLGERECSVQRRHQKLIEEAPSPLLDEESRSKLCAQAVALAKAVNYDSAGTVEFIAGEDRSFYFLEMNTRLQVEHPVTELVTGFDLVEHMIRSAAGEKIAIAQDGVQLAGWAIESRILAEDPERNFLPSSGRLKTYRHEAAGTKGGAMLRIDSGVREGSDIPIHYDSLIAKLVTHAPDRAAAINAQAEALDSFVIEGPSNNITFLAAVMRSERFIAGKLSTNFIAEEFKQGFAPIMPDGERALLLVSAAAAAEYVVEQRKRQISGQTRAAAQVATPVRRSIILGNERFDVATAQHGDGIAVRFEASGATHICKPRWKPGEQVWIGTINGKYLAVKLRPSLNGYFLSQGGACAEACLYTRREAELAALLPKKKAAPGADVLRAPMPALVKSIEVAAGQEVEAGEPLCVIEAMKMETVLRAGHDAKVRKIHVKPGDSIAIDAIIMTFD